MTRPHFTDFEGRELASGFDAELFLLEKGIKKVVKKERVRVESVDETVRGYEERGFAVVRAPDRYSLDCFGAPAFEAGGAGDYTTLMIAR